MKQQQDERIRRNASRWHKDLMSVGVQDVAEFLDKQRIRAKRTMNYEQFVQTLSEMFEGLVAAGHGQFDFVNIRQFLIMTEEEFNEKGCNVYFGELIRSFVVLVGGQCSDCMCPVRAVPPEALDFFEINHDIRGLANYMAPSNEATTKGCKSLINHIVNKYDGQILCKDDHSKDEDAHPDRGQDQPQVRVNLSCQGLRCPPLGSVQKRCLLPHVSSGYIHVFDFNHLS